MKIMIVDDEPKIRNGLTALLKNKKHWDVVGAYESANAALMALAETAPDVMITDIKMPGFSGLDLIAQIRERNSRIVIIILSGFSDFEFAQRAIELGVYRYLTKPTNPRELIRVLEQSETEHKAKPAEEPAAIPNLLARQAVDYIEMNFAQKIGLKEISTALYISPNYLSELFKKHMGINISEYILDVRMKKAKEYLKNPAYKIIEVSEMVGFTDSRYFSSTFKKWSGMTPNEYKNMKF